MFSGIIEETAKVVSLEKHQSNIDITLACSFVSELKIDQSVAHNGVCLTVVRTGGGTYTVTAMEETLQRSNLGTLQVGDEVIFEDMLHYTTVKTNMFNGIPHPAIVLEHLDGSHETLRRYVYEDYRDRMD